jgi:hypothetical protein
MRLMIKTGRSLTTYFIVLSLLVGAGIVYGLLALFIRRSDWFGRGARSVDRVDGCSTTERFGTRWRLLGSGSARQLGRVGYGACAVILPVSAISMAACG